MKKILLFTLMVVVSAIIAYSQQKAVLWSEDFEGDPSATWSASSGVWEMGSPTSGPSAAHSGIKCAATNLSGNYPTVADSRLFRLSYFTVPAAVDNPRLRFWHWYSFSTSDYGKVQMHVQGTPSTEWVDLTGQFINTGSSVWTYPSIDLTAFAGQKIQIGFYFHAEDPWPGGNVDAGWYIDDVSIITGPITFGNPETWENGIGDWNAENGTWEVGSPTSGPGKSHGGDKCAATVLAGNYATVVNSRLISPVYTVPAANQNPRLRFWHWYSFSTSDYGKVQIKVQGTSEWTDISGQYIHTGSSVWTYPMIDLTAFSGQKVQFGFNFYSEDPWPGGNVDAGWYIDDLSIVTGPITFNNPETWENGIGDWNPGNGTWEVGSPTSGPGKAHGGTKCAATVLAGNYATVVDSRLVSPVYTVPSESQNPRLRFWHWYCFSTSDYGKVQIHVEGTPTTEWVDLTGQFINTGSSVWTYPLIDLSTYAGQKVQFGFYFYAEDPWPGGNVDAGWYIDDISIVTGSIIFNNPETWENGLGDWYIGGIGGTWEVGTPASGPGTAHGGTKCAATVLSGNYATVVDSRLVSPVYTVPSASQNPRLRFWHWYSFSTSDYGKVQIKIQGSSEWTDISGQYIHTGSSVWTYPSIDLSAFAGQKVQFGFFFYAEDPWPGGNVDAGWYIDDISIITGPLTFTNPETWESGIGDWYVGSGTWEVGNPSSGPGKAHLGTKCAATVLAGNYAPVVESRLISPPVLIPNATKSPFLRFWHWYSFSTNDYGKVMVKVIGNADWENISQNYINTSGNVWTYPALDLGSYSDKIVQFAFYFYAEDPWPGGNVDVGWYIDDIEIQYDHTGIQENLIQKLNIYPNPFSEKATIQFDDTDLSGYRLSVYNISGTKVMEMKDIRSDKIELEKGALPAGIYIIELQGNKVYRNKVIIR